MGIGSIIEATPGTCGGRARLAGTRVPVHRIARYHRLGYAPEEMLGVLNSLSLSQIYAALAYALANPDEIQASLREEDLGLEISEIARINLNGIGAATPAQIGSSFPPEN